MNLVEEYIHTEKAMSCFFVDNIYAYSFSLSHAQDLILKKAPIKSSFLMKYVFFLPLDLLPLFSSMELKSR